MIKIFNNLDLEQMYLDTRRFTYYKPTGKAIFNREKLKLYSLHPEQDKEAHPFNLYSTHLSEVLVRVMGI